MKTKTIIPMIFFLASTTSIFIAGCKHGNEEQDKSFRFDTMAARVHSSSNYIMLGGRYSAEVSLLAFSTTLPMELEVDSTGNPNQSVSYNKGVCIFESIPDSEGTYQFSGKLKVKSPGGDEIFSYPFTAEYKVAKPVAVIVPTDFVLYRGKENKLDVSMPGFASEDVNILVSNASVKGENGKFIVTPGKENKCLITVTVRTKVGSKMLDQREYKVVDK